MITEDYVSFETAKLLKEKGFHVSDISMLVGNDNHPFISGNSGYEFLLQKGQEVYPAPTFQMAMKWLREVHNIAISVYVFNRDLPIEANNVIYTCDISTLNISSKDGHLRLAGSYEEVCEAAIKYCLENLI